MSTSSPAPSNAAPSRSDLYRPTPSLPLPAQTRSLFHFTNPKVFPTDQSDEDLAAHITAQRDKMYAKLSYPCLGLFRFLEPGSREEATTYRQAIHDCLISDPENTSILDMGCGYAQDVRAWIQDGVKGKQIAAADLVMDFVESSFELFADQKDQGHLKDVKFLECDIFKPDQVQRVKESSPNGNGFDIIYVGSFIHLFELGECDPPLPAVRRDTSTGRCS